MKAPKLNVVMRHPFIALVALAARLSDTIAVAQTARDVRGANPVVPVETEPPAKIVADPPFPDSLANGCVFIQYRTENLHIVSVFGPKALDDSPRIGHIHVTVDDTPVHWADSSGESLIIVGLAAGPRKVLIELVNSNHGTLDKATLNFMVPKQVSRKTET
jgi:hypothetical protein